MIRPLAAAAAAAAVATLALAPFAGPGVASAQTRGHTWGQPIYLNAYGRPVGGSPLSEVETRSYVATGRWADGYSDRPQVYVPAPGYGRPNVSDQSDYRGYGRGGPEWRYALGRGHGAYRYDLDRYGHGAGRSDRRSGPGYRDEWGYNDDRPPSSPRGGSVGSRSYGSRDCGCADVYFYDR